MRLKQLTRRAYYEHNRPFNEMKNDTQDREISETVTQRKFASDASSHIHTAPYKQTFSGTNLSPCTKPDTASVGEASPLVHAATWESYVQEMTSSDVGVAVRGRRRFKAKDPAMAPSSKSSPVAVLSALLQRRR